MKPFTVDWWLKQYLNAYLVLDDYDTYGKEWGLTDEEIQIKMIRAGKIMSYCKERIKRRTK